MITSPKNVIKIMPQNFSILGPLQSKFLAMPVFWLHSKSKLL